MSGTVLKESQTLGRSCLNTWEIHMPIQISNKNHGGAYVNFRFIIEALKKINDPISTPRKSYTSPPSERSQQKRNSLIEFHTRYWSCCCGCDTIELRNRTRTTCLGAEINLLRGKFQFSHTTSEGSGTRARNATKCALSTSWSKVVDLHSVRAGPT